MPPSNARASTRSPTSGKPMSESSPPKGTECGDFRVADFDYDLPEELIAQQPPAERGTSRMLVMDRATGALEMISSPTLEQHLRQGDLLVLNDSRVIPARLYARRTLRREREKPTGRIEVMLTEPAGENQWRALVQPGPQSRHRRAPRLSRAHGRDRARSRSAGARRIRRAPARICARSTISSPSSTASATCRCRRTSAATTRTPIASATRLSSRASAARWPRPPPACTSRRRCSMRSTAQGRRDRARHAPRRPGHLCAAAR